MDVTLLNSPMRSSRAVPTVTSPLKTPERASSRLSDRFIPDRSSQDPQMSHFHLTSKENTTPASRLSGTFTPGTPPPAFPRAGSCNEPYTNMLARTLLYDAQTTVLGLHQNVNTPYRETDEDRYRNCMSVVYEENRARNFRSKNFRIIAQTPERILDAPELLDDFYLNLIDWSCSNILTVALSSTVYLWNAESGGITQLMSSAERENIISGVSWHPEGSLLAIASNDGNVQLWDTETQRLTRTFEGHSGRVVSLSWNGNLLASGGRDTTIQLHDQREPRFTAAPLTAHTQEVCGLRWSPNSQQLASGGNDNQLCIWDFRRHSMECAPLWSLREHSAAIKALSWNPVQHNLLVSGGGTADKTLRFWNTSTGQCVQTVDTKSQVCGVLWSRSGNELISSHGYSDNQLTLWKYPSLKRITDLTGHTSRVLHLAMSPDGQTVVSAAGDETIRFWRCFGPLDGYQSRTPPSSPQDLSGIAESLR
jgi:cell division cycle protein 20 (cofactor of APC complex)